MSDKDKIGYCWRPKLMGRLKEIESLNISGISFERQDLRVYPEASSSAHLLGFVGKDDEGKNKGYFGLEGIMTLSYLAKKDTCLVRKMLWEK